MPNILERLTRTLEHDGYAPSDAHSLAQQMLQKSGMMHRRTKKLVKKTKGKRKDRYA